MNNLEEQQKSARGGRVRFVLLCVLFFLALVSVVLCSFPQIFPIADETLSRLLMETVPRLFVGGFLVALLLYAGYGGSLRLRRKGLLRAVLWSLPCLLVALANFPYSALIGGTATIGRGDLVPLFLLKCLSVAIMEELFFRALAVPFLLERLKGRLKEGYAVLLSAAVFSLSHLFNLLLRASVPATLLQVGYTFLLGCMFAVQLLETGSVWHCVLVHFLFDVGGVIVTDLGSGYFQDVVFWCLTAAAGVLCAVHVTISLVRRLRMKREE